MYLSKWAALPELLMKNHILNWHYLLYSHYSMLYFWSMNGKGFYKMLILTDFKILKEDFDKLNLNFRF